MPKHVVVPYVVDYLHTSTNKLSCVRKVYTLHSTNKRSDVQHADAVSAQGVFFYFVTDAQKPGDITFQMHILHQTDRVDNFPHCIFDVYFTINLDKGKAVPLQAWGGPEGSRKLRFPDFMTKAQDGGKVVSLTHRPLLPPGNTPGTHFW